MKIMPGTPEQSAKRQTRVEWIIILEEGWHCFQENLRQLKSSRTDIEDVTETSVENFYYHLNVCLRLPR